MRIAGTWNPAEIDEGKRKAAFAALDAAYEAGYRLFDHADIYARGACESLFGEWLRANPSLRAQVTIATKCGIRFAGSPEPDSPGRYDFSYRHIVDSTLACRERLGIHQIDLLQLHRPDYLMDPMAIGEAFAKLHGEGVVREFGVSNFTTSQMGLLRAAGFGLVVNQIEFSLWHDSPLDDGVLDVCHALDMTPLAWSPLAGGFLGRPSQDEPDPDRRRTVEAVESVAKRHDATPSQIALAWILCHPSNVVPIVGSTRPESIREAVASQQIDLDREDWYRLLVARRGKPMP